MGRKLTYTVEIFHDVILAVLLPPFCCEILSCKLYLDCLLSACCRSLELKKGQRDVIFAGEGLLGLTNLHKTKESGYRPRHDEPEDEIADRF